MDWVERVEPLRQAQADTRLTPMECRVFVMLWTFADPDGCNSRPGITLLTESLSTAKRRVHDRSVRSALKRLEELGYITCTAKAVRRRGIANTYRVQMPLGLPVDEECLPRKALRGKHAVLPRNSESLTAQKWPPLARTGCAPSSREGKTEARAKPSSGNEHRDCTSCGGDGWVLGRDGCPLEPAVRCSIPVIAT